MIREVSCQHCGSLSTVAQCSLCDREFVVTNATLRGELRQLEDAAALAVTDRDDWVCDFDMGKQVGPGAAVTAGMRQRTCPACHTQFI